MLFNDSLDMILKIKNYRVSKIAHLFFFIGLITFMGACHEQLEESKALAEQVKKRKIGKIKPLEILEETKRLGTLIVQESEAIWMKNLLQEVNEKKDSTRSTSCKILLMSVDSIKSNDILISKWGTQNIKLGIATGQEEQLLEAYFYNSDHKLPLTENIQKIGDSLMLYTEPITYHLNQCSSCHQSIVENQFAGMWSVKLRKKNIIENIWLNK